LKKTWQVREPVEKYNEYDSITEKILRIRGIKNKEQFLNPNENDINSLLDDIKKNPKLSNSANNTMFIYDYFTDLAGIGIQTSEGEYIIPMRENKFFGIKKNEVKASSDYIKKINSFYQKVKNKTQDDKTGGIVSNSDMSTKKKTHYVVIIGVSVLGIIVGLGGIFILRKRLRENIA
jgi:hypothetical protein